MNVVCLGSKGSAVTTTALALAGGWPVTSAPVVMVEADPAGGDIAARFDLAASPSLLTAAASLQQPTVGLLLEHTHTLPGGLRVLPAPLRSLEVAGGMNDFTRAVVAPLRGSHDVHLVIDAGRCDVRTIPALTLHADLVVIVIRQELRSAQATVGRCLHAQQVVETLATRGMPIVAVVVGDAPYKADEIGQFLGLPVLGVLAEDPHGASHLAGRSATSRAARRSHLAKSAAGVADKLAAELTRALVPA